MSNREAPEGMRTWRLSSEARAGRAWLMATHLGLEPYGENPLYGILGGALETSPGEPD